MSEVERAVRAAWYSMFTSRPRLMGSVLTGVVAGLGLAKAQPGWPAATTMIVGWDVTCLIFLVSTLPLMWGTEPARIRTQAAEQDQGRMVILVVILLAAAASVWAIAAQLDFAKSEHGIARTGHVTLAFLTVALSWMMVQVVFALHYAHEYYDENQECLGHDMKGLLFPGGELPDYWDFIHFSIVIGVAAQTADIAFTSKELRRIGTVHSLVAFAYNTVIVALTINLLAGLF